MNRRDFVKTAAVVPAAILGSHLSILPAALSQRRPPITTVVYDERYADSRTFADTLARGRAVRFATDGDFAKLWHTDLRAHLKQHGGQLAGLTTDSDFVVASACSRELKFQVLYEGAHDGRSAMRLTHRLRFAASEQSVFAALFGSDVPWAESLGNELLRIPSIDDFRTRTALAERTAVTALHPGDTPGYLTSWLLRLA
jgi:hypothetical protein